MPKAIQVAVSSVGYQDKQEFFILHMSENIERLITIDDTQVDEIKKKEFFSRLGLSVRDALKFHKQEGLWENEGEKQTWKNVSEHCLVETARATTLAELVQLPQDIIESLKISAALHDFNKKTEVEMLKKSGTWETYQNANKSAEEKMKGNFSDRIIKYAGAVGHASFMETKKLLKKKEKGPEDIAYLIMHYVDDYTIGSNWVSPAEMAENGKKINDLERRLSLGNAKPQYQELIESTKNELGPAILDEYLKTGKEIEKNLTDLIREKTGAKIEAEELPEYIDQKIKDKIEKI